MARCLELQAHWDSWGRSGDVPSNFRNVSSYQQMFYLPSTQSTVIKGLKNYFPDLNNANKLWKNPLAQSQNYFVHVHAPFILYGQTYTLTSHMTITTCLYLWCKCLFIDISNIFCLMEWWKVYSNAKCLWFKYTLN